MPLRVTPQPEPAEQPATPPAAPSLASIEERLRSRVIGQGAALDELLACYRRFAAGLAPANRPAGIYLLLGPTGSGKSLTAQQLANAVTGKPGTLLKVDGGEFTQSHEVAKMTGSPPGYLGHRETPAYLNTAALNAQRSVDQPLAFVLLDEVDKFHPRVWDLFLGIFDTGQLRLGDNTTVDFTDTIILMTGNTGARAVQESITPTWGLGVSNPAVRSTDGGKIAESAAKRLLRPEMFNRIDKVLTFQALGPAEMAQILDLELMELCDRLVRRKHIGLQLDASAKALVLAAGLDPKYGARDLKRAVSRLVEQPLATEIVEGRIVEHSLINATVADGRITFNRSPEVL